MSEKRATSHRRVILKDGRITIPKDLRDKHKLLRSTFYEIIGYDEKTDVMTIRFIKI